MKRGRTHQQLELSLRRNPNWGGARRGAGRKRRGRQKVPHRRRLRFSGARAVHITTRLAVRGLRRRKLYQAIRAVFCATCDQGRFRICHFSVQREHIHLVVEASDRAALTGGMRKVNIRLAAKINRQLGRKKGKVIADRYHEEHMESPRQIRNTLAYVINNSRRHLWKERKERFASDWIDGCSSGEFFDGWRTGGPSQAPGPGDPVAAPRTHLLRHGWRRHGLIAIDEIPGR